MLPRPIACLSLALALAWSTTGRLYAQDYQHDKILQEAIAKGDLAKVTELIEADPARLNRKIQFHSLPLYVAIDKCQVKIVKYLLEKGANPNEIDDKFGEHSLFFLVKLAPFRDAKRLDLIKEILQMLVAHKVDVKLRNNDGETALYSLAATEFRLAGLPLKFEFMKLLMEQGASLNGQDKTKLPVLFMLFDSARARTLMRLHDPNTADKAKEEPRQAVIDTLRFLLENGADPDAVDANNNTMMIKVLKVKEEILAPENKAEMIKLLIDHGANVRKRNKAGERPSNLINDNELLKEALKHRPEKKKK